MVLISGASIAGPALALWLHRYGADLTVAFTSGCAPAVSSSMCAEWAAKC
jgi:hypothetical protein